MHYQASYDSRVTLTANDRSAIEHMLASMSGVSSIGYQNGRTKYSMSRGTIDPLNIHLTIQRGAGADHIHVDIRHTP